MAAVAERAYRAALVLLDAIRACPDSDEVQRSAAIFPPNASPDHSPLLVLCCNDTCSFTWTGQEHINQVSHVGFLILFFEPQLNFLDYLLTITTRDEFKLPRMFINVNVIIP